MTPWVCISVRASVCASVCASVGVWASVCRSGWSCIVVPVKSSGSNVAAVLHESSGLSVEPPAGTRAQSRGHSSIKRWVLALLLVAATFRDMGSATEEELWERKRIQSLMVSLKTWRKDPVEESFLLSFLFSLSCFLQSSPLLSSFPYSLGEER